MTYTRVDRNAPLRNWIERAIGKRWASPPVKVGVKHGMALFEIDWADGTTARYFINYAKRWIIEDSKHARASEGYYSAEDRNYGAACPWNAPGMSVKDFI